MSEYDPCVKKNPPRPTNLPEGWELTREYRPPLAGEYFLNVSSSGDSVENAIANFVNPCWILQRKKDKPIITKTYTKPTAEDWGFGSRKSKMKEVTQERYFTNLDNRELMNLFCTTTFSATKVKACKEILRRMGGSK